MDGLLARLDRIDAKIDAKMEARELSRNRPSRWRPRPKAEVSRSIDPPQLPESDSSDEPKADAAEG